MKPRIISLLCLFLITGVAKAQNNNHEFVDLGLSVEWATCNIGAETPEGYGDYYAWGEVTPKKVTTGAIKDDYSFYENDWKDWVIYKYIGEDISGTRYDAATANWGSEWRMPTRAEIEELMNSCDVLFTERNGVKGHLFTGPNGNTIFLPAAGHKAGFDIDYLNQIGIYWSSTLEPTTEVDGVRTYTDVYVLVNDQSTNYVSCKFDRATGYSIRPVRNTRELNPVGDSKYGVLVYKKNGEVIDVPGDNLVEISTYEDELNGHEVVDLGLSIGWAAKNIGADSPEMAGTYFAWGETTPKNSYRMENYKFGIPPSKYNSDDGILTLELEDDAAHVNWGGKWRMPTREEEEELYDMCTWTWTNMNGVDGFQVTGPNGNSIFLPTSGLYDGDSTDDIKRKDTGGWYWSATKNGNRYACGICFPTPNNLYKNVPNHEREDGHVIRPVLGVTKSVDRGIFVDRVSGTDVKIPLEQFDRILTYENPLYVDPNNPGGGGSGGDDEEEHEAVDLGLSVKWATCNIDAETPEEAGGYYAWGELAEKDMYNMSTYIGPNATVLYDIEGTEYDVAHVKWKGDWRMPTRAEITELYQKCSHEWYTQNGVYGKKFTASNGNSIFLPAGGGMWDDKLDGVGRAVRIWSSSYAGYESAFGILFFNDAIQMNRYSRGYGFPVRAVKP